MNSSNRSACCRLPNVGRRFRLAARLEFNGSKTASAAIFSGLIIVSI